GASGLVRQIDHAFDMASYLSELLEQTGDFIMLSSNPPPCLQACSYPAPGGKRADNAAANTQRTQRIVDRPIQRGLSVDYAPGDKGSFLRVVVNVQTLPTTVEGLAKAIHEIAKQE